VHIKRLDWLYTQVERMLAGPSQSLPYSLQTYWMACSLNWPLFQDVFSLERFYECQRFLDSQTVVQRKNGMPTKKNESEGGASGASDYAITRHHILASSCYRTSREHGRRSPCGHYQGVEPEAINVKPMGV